MTKISNGFFIAPYSAKDTAEAVALWNSIVKAGRAFPQEDELDLISGHEFFRLQTFTGIARSTTDHQLAGLYILHDNNVGRCRHIANASYAVAESFRGRGIGELLVRHCIEQAGKSQYKILQFNAVVKSNTPALNLYRKLGFVQLGIIPAGFRNIHGEYEDIIPHYITL